MDLLRNIIGHIIAIIGALLTVWFFIILGITVLAVILNLVFSIWEKWKNRKPPTPPNPELRKQAFLFVGGIYFLTLATIYVLAQFAPVKAHFDAVLKEFSGSVTIAATGILGAFLSIFVIAIIAIRYLSK